MKEFWKKISPWTWEIIQTLIGYLLVLWYGGVFYQMKDNRRVYTSTSMPGGISLGKVILISSLYLDKETVIKHEYGHCVQSSYLGPLYLIVIGIPSILNAMFGFTEDYYDFYTEKWADSLGGVDRS